MKLRKPASRNGDDKPDRRKEHRRGDIKDLELAGGVEGGMEAGSAGGPGQADIERARDRRAGR
jgi:hypothetical protein